MRWFGRVVFCGFGLLDGPESFLDSERDEREDTKPVFALLIRILDRFPNLYFAEGSNTASMTPPGSNQQQRVLAKTTSVGFIENLNAKLAEQRLSGKAYAVRSLINSKALVI